MQGLAFVARKPLAYRAGFLPDTCSLWDCPPYSYFLSETGRPWDVVQNQATSKLRRSRGRIRLPAVLSGGSQPPRVKRAGAELPEAQHRRLRFLIGQLGQKADNAVRNAMVESIVEVLDVTFRDFRVLSCDDIIVRQWDGCSPLRIRDRTKQGMRNSLIDCRSGREDD
jgi:hypothetical protein